VRVTPPPRKTRFRLLVQLCRAGLVTRRVPVKGFTFEVILLFRASWRKVRQVLEQAERAFQVGPGRPVNLDNAKDRKIGQLEAKLAHKNEVIAELMEEHVKLKKGLGEL
jgi:transposase